MLSTVVGGDAYIAPYTRLTHMGTVVEKYIRSIPGIAEYVIMPNHVHMIMRISATDTLQGPMWASAPTKASIPSIVRSWKTLVSKELGQSIWQRSYYDHVIRDETDYVVKARYIADNPAKCGMMTITAVDGLKQKPGAADNRRTFSKERNTSEHESNLPNRGRKPRSN